MTQEERKERIHEAADELAQIMTGFYGSVTVNIQNGRYINCNIAESIRPEKQEKRNGR